MNCASLGALFTAIVFSWWLSAPACEAFQGLDESVSLDDVPHVVKLPDFGGEACLEMALQRIDQSYTQKDVFNLSEVDPREGRGCNAKELAATAKKLGFNFEHPWNDIETRPKMRPAWRATKTAFDTINDGHPVICLMRQRHGNQVVEQFVLVTGVDMRQREVTLHDPNALAGKDRKMSLQVFENAIICTDPNGSKYTFCLALQPGTMSALERSEEKFTDADFAQHIRKLKKTLPNDDFHIVIQKPFVVVGDESLERVKARATRTVKWAVDLIKKDYFTKDPSQILDVWLFKDKNSYYKNAEKLWGERPGTPYGYYSSSDGALVMNISTGGGTLVHEIVHPFIESNFPKCPSWFNEGLASLYEQSYAADGKIMGSTNWRLRGLQGAIKADRVPEFRELCSTTRREFYNEDPGTNYSQARYLCYYLQEKKLLRKYYHQFVKNSRDDATGYKTLMKVLETDDMKQFKKDWQAFVMKLRF